MRPPRLHAILARDAPFGVVFRRGPSKQVAVYGWTTKDDIFELGQWLKGRIYERRADLSPDGKHMIYFAMDGKWQGEMGGSWTAISRAPYLTALHLYGWGDCWNGGGLFTSNTRYWVNGAGLSTLPVKSVPCDLSRQDTPPERVTPMRGEDPTVYFPKLQRDGWELVEPQSGKARNIAVFRKPVRAHWAIEKTFHARMRAGPNGQSYWETHRLISREGILDYPDWEWADVEGRDVVFAKEGAIWRMRVHAKQADTARLLCDFTGMSFEQKEAPYYGVEKGGVT
jgi:hypothetical protein